LLRQGAESIGMRISKEAVQRKIQEMAVFNNNGRFDLANYKAVLERNKLSHPLLKLESRTTCL
jgi:peptidyl-prolyl cis-trans isomerase D